LESNADKEAAASSALTDGLAGVVVVAAKSDGNDSEGGFEGVVLVLGKE